MSDPFAGLLPTSNSSFSIPVITAAPVSVPSTTTGVSNKGTANNPWANSGTSIFVTPRTTVPTKIELQTKNVPVAEPSPAQQGQGNALISIPIIQSNGTTQYIPFNVWIFSFQTGSYTTYDNDQVHRGMVWFPIRRNEMFVQFGIMWPLQSKKTPNGFQNMQSFQNYLRLHQQQSVLTNGQPTPLSFVYYNNTGTAKGLGQTNKSSVIDNNLAINGNNQDLINQSYAITANGASSSTSQTTTGNLQALAYQGWIDRVEKEYRRFKSAYVKTYRMNILNTDVSSSRLMVNNLESSIVPSVISAQQYGVGWSSANLSLGNGINISSITG